MKKFISLLLLSLSLMIPVFASNTPEPSPSNQEIQASTPPVQQASRFSLQTSSAGTQYLLNATTGEKVIQAFAYNEAGELVAIPLSEYKRIRDSMQDLPLADNTSQQFELETYPTSPRAITNTYIERMSYVIEGAPLKVSADMRGPGRITTVQAVSLTSSFGGDIGVTIYLEDLIAAGASFTWNSTATSEASNSYEFDPIPAGSIGYVNFIPYFNVSEGDLYQIRSESSLPPRYLGYVWGQSPKTTATGFADGLFELIIEDE